MLVYNTLLEIYMREIFVIRSTNHTSNNNNNNNKDNNNDNKAMELIKEIENKIMKLLKNNLSKYDENHALVVAKMYGIEKAVIFLYERLHLYHEVLHHHMERNEISKIIETCERFSKSDPNLYVQAFTYLIKYHSNDDYNESNENKQSQNSKDNHANMDKYLSKILEQIFRRKLLPPLIVIESLSQTKISLEIIGDYIINILGNQQSNIEKNEQEIGNLRNEILIMKNEMSELTNKAKTFQATKCSHCLAPLDLPTLHFLCGHSIHERCLFTKNNVKCPKCLQTYEEIQNKQEMMHKSKADHDTFFGQLQRAHQQGDGFSTVAEYFGRGVIG